MRTSGKGICFLILGAAIVVAGPAYGDEVAQPWGTFNGNILGTARSDHPSLVFDSGWYGGAEVDWSLDIRALGVDRPQTGQMSFDEEGNIYWKSSSANNLGQARIASASPTGTLRWSATNTDGVTEHRIGPFDTTAPVVGDGGATGRVYSIGTNDAGSVAVAYRKDTGVLVWQTVLPGAVFPGRDGNVTPILYGGKLYVKSAGANPMLYQLDSATGAIDWSNAVNGIPAIGGDFEGGMTLVPDAFGAGMHGLYFNGTSGNGTDGVGEMYAVNIDTAGGVASLAWSADGGHVNRSHVIYVPSSNRVCTHTWTDFGAEFYCWDLDGSDPAAINNISNSGHGFYDVGVLDWNNTDVIAGGFNGQVVRYSNITAPTTGDPPYEGAVTGYYQMTTWFGEPRVYGGLYKDANGDSILVTGTNSRSDLGPDHEARVIAVNLTTGNLIESCEDLVDDAAVYVDNIKITGGDDPANQSVIHLDVAGFEGYTAGDLPGQANTGGTGTVSWEDYESGAGGAAPPAQIVADPTGAGRGNVLQLDALGACGGFQGIFGRLPAEANNDVVVVSWDQYRPDLDDNLWVGENTIYDRWFGFQHDLSGGIYALGTNPSQLFECGTSNNVAPFPLTAGQWQHVEYQLDFEFGIVSLRVDGVCVAEGDIAFSGQPEAAVRGIEFELEATEFTRSTAAYTPTIFEHNTGIIVDHGFTTRGGPLLGPAGQGAPQHIYYFETASGRLVALKPSGVTPCTPVLASAVSRRTHGAAGTFDIPLPTTGAVAVEPRQNGPQQIVLTYDRAIGGTPTVVLSSGTLGEVTASGSDLTINLSGVTDGACVSITVGGVACAEGGTAAADQTIKVRAIYGDVNGNGSVNVADIGLVKSRSGLPLDETSFKMDLNANGTVNVADIGLVKSRSGITAAEPCSN